MREAIIVEGRKENFVSAECFVALEMNYCLDSSRLKGSFYRGKADQAKIKMAVYPNQEACEQGGTSTDTITLVRDNVSENPELAAHVQAIFGILSQDLATELSGEIVELTFPPLPEEPEEPITEEK